MLDFLGEAGAIFAIGLLGGIALGLAARLGRFCTLGMIEDAHFGQDLTRAWMWLAALGTAMVANFLADGFGFIDLGVTFQLINQFSLAGAVVGGLLFGYGMALAGNCGFGMLARLGGGDLRALVIALVMGVSAYATLSGVLSLPRVMLFPVETATTPSGVAHLISTQTGLPLSALGVGIGCIALFCAVRQLVKAGRINAILWAMVAGVAISSGFAGTFWVASEGFELWDVTSHSFTQPIGATMQYAMFSSALSPSFGVGSVLGVVLGGTIGSFLRQEMRWEACEDHRELRRQMFGAALMGLGAVLAAGCSIGQGLSAFSVLSMTAPVVGASIWLGAWFGLRKLILGAHHVA